MSKDEVDRIRQVYHDYDTSGNERSKRDHSNPGQRAILAERNRAIVDCLQGSHLQPLWDKQILDIGCGVGALMALLQHIGASSFRLYGVDLLHDRIALAQLYYPDMHFFCANAEELEFPDASFDLVLLFTVFSSILDERMGHNVASEVRRILKPRGAVLWYDVRYQNPWNPHTRAMKLEEIRRRFPGFDLHLRAITLIPPLARRLGRLTPGLYPVLTSIPWLRTHYLGLLVKPAAAR